MNDDELRDHLRSTLEPVSSPTPELARLRRIARRRRRRLQATAGGLGLLLIVGAGVGIAEATSSSSGRSGVTVGSPPPASTVSLTCAAATHDSKPVMVPFGASLVLTDCPPGAVAIASGNGVLDPTGPLAFQAAMAGLDGVELRYSSCALAPASVQSRCDGGAIVIGFDVTVTGTRGEPSLAKGPPPESVPCKGGPVSVLVGQDFDLTNCPVGLQSKIDDPSVLASAGTPSEFTALRAGTTNVELYVEPECSPGTMCPKYVRDLGTLVVTVTAR